MPFLDQFDVVLLDMNGTFMFDHDRLGPEEDFYHTYRTVGGRRLERRTVTSIMRSTCDALLVAYDDPAHFDNFPTLREAFPKHGAPEEEVEVLEQVFAVHELGKSPPVHVRFLHGLAKTHQLGVVSNICAPPSACEIRLREVGLDRVFTHTILSSQARSIKPSPAIFRRALAAFDAGARVLFVGDSLERDIRPASGLGLRTAWIAPPGRQTREADVVIASLLELATVAT
ncbi:MAG: HAD family hydrolase [Gemmatimonadales bacterium]|nr:HAD family hydrolase [Gemmatimonadales bacterium]